MRLLSSTGMKSAIVRTRFSHKLKLYELTIETHVWWGCISRVTYFTSFTIDGKSIFIQIFLFLLSRFIIFFIFIRCSRLWYVMYGACIKMHAFFIQASIKIVCWRMWHIHLIWFIHKKRYNTLKICSTNHSTCFFFFKYFNKGICVCMVAKYIMRSIACCCCNLIMLHSSRSAIT